jgi:hypothetical protein
MMDAGTGSMTQKVSLRLSDPCTSLRAARTVARFGPLFIINVATGTDAGFASDQRLNPKHARRLQC